MRNMANRLRALEGAGGSSRHEDWVNALEREERGETVDCSAFTPGDPEKLQELAGEED